MQAQVYRKYGGPEVLSLEDVDKPSPKPDEVLVKIHNAGVAAGDWHVLRGEPFAVRLMMGLLKPKNQTLGYEVSGVVEEVGSNVTDFHVGDEVFGEISSGGFAEYVAAKTTSLILKPKTLSHKVAATLPVSSVTALQAVRDHAQVKKGENVLILGASGGVGSFAVQFAKHFGAEVTAVISDKAMSAIAPFVDHVINYKQEDVVALGAKYDVIIDAAAYRNYKDYEVILSDSGRYILVGGSGKQLFGIMLFGGFMKKPFKNFLAKPNKKDLHVIADLVVQNKIIPVLDKVFTLAQLPEAINHLEQRKAVGKSVVAIR